MMMMMMMMMIMMMMIAEYNKVTSQINPTYLNHKTEKIVVSLPDADCLVPGENKHSGS